MLSRECVQSTRVRETLVQGRGGEVGGGLIELDKEPRFLTQVQKGEAYV